ncbi:hypothetical protein [Clostridium pasteurianum]|uniref:Uncharacterized protein n=1 Tax=Clostridium pasteurianum BC1 TaxID=86416 RepID=R4K0M0_CLOPA|nr:hypothetical protein [Clostridium pasteurianum]AGK96632.1 hypothetical protein Clopa_1711 [Clostridium pasteurianum BC1]
MKELDLKEAKMEGLKLEEVNIDELEILEDGATPSFGFGCPHGWFGAYCN